MSLLAFVALDNTSLSFDKEYTYLVPESFEQKIFPGCRVFVPFGRGNAKRLGVVLRLAEGEAEGKKAIFSILDSRRYLSDELLQLIIFLKKRYFCTYFDALKTVLPKGINYRTQAVFCADALKRGEIDSLSAEERGLYLFLLSQEVPLKQSDISKKYASSDENLLNILVKKGYLLKENRAQRNMGDATQKMLRFQLGEDEYAARIASLPKKQRMVADFLHDVGCASVKEVFYYCAVTKVVCDGLVKKGIAVYYDKEVLEFEKAPVTTQAAAPIALSQAQQKAYDGILQAKNAADDGCCALLFGVTGSGKTQVYLRLIDNVLDSGKEVIVMVPEISLTPQTLSIFKNRYGNEVAIFHSRLSVGQRMDEWKKVKSGKAKIVVGTRSAVFAPFDNLGLIIIDEEQEHTYKSEMTPRYHAIEVAKMRCHYHKALLLLSSATPSVEDFAKAKQGIYHLESLPKRYGHALLPEVLCVDMREQKTEDGEQKVISEPMLEALKDILAKTAV